MDFFHYRDCTVPLMLTNTMYGLSMGFHILATIIAIYKLCRLSKHFYEIQQQQYQGQTPTAKPKHM